MSQPLNSLLNGLRQATLNHHHFLVIASVYLWAIITTAVIVIYTKNLVVPWDPISCPASDRVRKPDGQSIASSCSLS